MKPNLNLRFKLFGKKRGDRRTGSQTAGSLGEAIFFGSLFLLGTISLTALITSQVVRPTPEIYRPGFGFWLVVLVLSSLLIIGGLGVLYTVIHAGASAERRSAIVRRAAAIDLIRDALPSPQDFPTVPRDERMTDSPGVQLTYRLPAEVNRTIWRLAATAAVSLLLSGFASILSVIFLAGLLIGNPNLVLLAFTVPFIGFGTWSTQRFLNEVWRFSRVGPTYVEISDLPLYPGEDYEVAVSQSGRFQLNSIQVSLICEEEATYYQGTDVRTETRVVSTSELIRREGVDLDGGNPLVLRANLAVPLRAVHSFQTTHNAVRWKLLVQGEPASAPQFKRNFPVIVYPNCNGTNTPAEGQEVDRTQVDHGTADQPSNT